MAAAREDAEPGATRAGEQVSLEQYRLMFERNPHPMWVYDRDTLAFIAVNDAAVAHYGYSRDEFLGMTIEDIRPTEDLPALAENLTDYERAPGSFEMAGCWRHRKKDAAIIEVEISSHELPFAGRRGKVVLAHDVTARRRAERAQRAQLAVIESLAAGGTVEEAGPKLLETLAATMRWDAAALWMLDEAAGLLRLGALWLRPVRGRSALRRVQRAMRSATFARGVGLPGEAWERGGPTLGVVGREGDPAPRAAALARASLRAGLAVPILSGDHIVGVLELLAARGEDMEDGAQSVLIVAAAQFGAFVARKRAEQQLSYQALHAR